MNIPLGSMGDASIVAAPWLDGRGSRIVGRVVISTKHL